jgi:hypothetical protein
MRDKTVELYSILQDNSQLDSYVQGYFEGPDREIDLFHYKLRRLDQPGYRVGTDHCGDDSEPLDFGE